MNLLDAIARPCVLMEKRREPDGAGGYITTWAEGAEFQIYQTVDTTMEARRAEQAGLTSLYSVLVDLSFPIEYNDCYKDLSTGETYRVTSDPEEKRLPEPSTMKLKYFTAEKRKLPL